jgi:predicted GNAT family acetyltransferase
MAAAVAQARERGLKIQPSCSYADAYMQRHPEAQDLLA